MDFGSFSSERYNGILGSYPTNETRDTTQQIMEIFFREVDDFHLELPDMYKEPSQNPIFAQKCFIAT